MIIDLIYHGMVLTGCSIILLKIISDRRKRKLFDAEQRRLHFKFLGKDES